MAEHLPTAVEPEPERVLSPELALCLALQAGRLEVSARPGHPVIAGAAAGLLVALARPAHHPEADLRVCEGRVWKRVERVPVDLEPDPKGEVHQRYRVELVPARKGEEGAELHQCGASLKGKRRQARYCDECVGIVRKVDTKRRLRARTAAAKQLDELDETLDDYVVRVQGSADDLDEIRDELSRIPERQRAAILNVMAGDLDAKTTDALDEPLPLSEAYQPPEHEGQEAEDLQPRLDEPERSADRAARDVRWCMGNRAAGWRYVGNPPGSLGCVRRTHAHSPRKGPPRLRHALDATREDVWRERYSPVLPASFYGWPEGQLTSAHGQALLRAATWDRAAG